MQPDVYLSIVDFRKHNVKASILEFYKERKL